MTPDNESVFKHEVTGLQLPGIIIIIYSWAKCTGRDIIVKIRGII